MYIHVLCTSQGSKKLPSSHPGLILLLIFPFHLPYGQASSKNIEIKTLIDGETNPNPFRLEQHILWKPQIYKTFEKCLNFCQH